MIHHGMYGSGSKIGTLGPVVSSACEHVPNAEQECEKAAEERFCS